MHKEMRWPEDRRLRLETKSFLTYRQSFLRVGKKLLRDEVCATQPERICERRWGELRKERCNAVLSRPTWSTKAAFLAAVMVLGTCCARFPRAFYLSKTEIPVRPNAPGWHPLCERNRSATIKGFSGARWIIISRGLMT